MEYEVIDLDSVDYDYDDTRNLLMIPRNSPYMARPMIPPRRAFPTHAGQMRPPAPPVPPPHVAHTRAPILRRDGGLSTGKLVKAAAQVLAAMTPLPGAPRATGDVPVDIAAFIEYQSLLAQHAKRDEQLRTVGALVSDFLQ